MTELIKTENYGRTTNVYIAGINIGKILKGFSIEQEGEFLTNPVVTLEFGVADMIRLLSEIPREDFERALEILKMYVDANKEAVDAATTTAL